MRVLNIGTYDLIHPGHLYVFRQLRAIAGDGEVVVGVNTDAFVDEFKGHVPVQNYHERAEVLSALRDIDRVIPNIDGADTRPLLEAVAPDIIAVGRDWFSPDDSKYCRQMGFDREWLAEHHIKLVYMDWLPGHSSTNLRTIAKAM